MEYVFTFVVSTFPYVAQPERLKYFHVLFTLQRRGNSHGYNLFDGGMHDTKVSKMVTRLTHSTRIHGILWKAGGKVAKAWSLAGF